jgi:phosphoserine phosphatase RsbU/P
MRYVNQFSLLLPLGFFVVACAQFLGIISVDAYSVTSLYTRDGIILLSLILSLPLIYKQKWASDRNVLRGLRHLFFLILITSSILFLSGNRLSTLQDRFFDRDLLTGTFADSVFIISWAFFAVVFIFIALGTLRNLIYVKRKRTTARNFTWLMIFLLLYSITSVPVYYAENGFDSKIYIYLNNATLFIFLNFAIINSFRVGWINYLNKKQKLGCFWGGLILTPVQIMFLIRFREINPIISFSPLLERFIELGVVFITIYLVTSFLALLSHLPTARIYDRKMQQIQSLQDLSRALSSEFDWSKLVRTIIKLASEVAESEFAWLELYDQKAGKLSLISSKNLTAVERKVWKSSTEGRLVDWLWKTKETMICNQVSKTELVSTIKLWKKDLGSLIAVPLITSDRILGFLYAGQKEEFGFEQDDAEMLRAFSDQAAIAVENARLVEESIVKERLEQELRIAHEAQMKLLPKQMPQLDGLEIDAVCITANEVGGDYYDFFELGPHKLGVVIGDVSGKGPSAAFYMAEVKGIMEALAKNVLSPKDMLVAANEILYKNFDRKTFISLIYGIIDAEERCFTFCRAGHCPLYYIDSECEEPRVLEPRGLGVGLDAGAIFEKTLEPMTIKMSENDTLMLFTDGVTEARNPKGEEFGEERLAEALLQAKDETPTEIKKSIIHNIYTFFDGQNAYDDLTFIIIKALSNGKDL